MYKLLKFNLFEKFHSHEEEIVYLLLSLEMVLKIYSNTVRYGLFYIIVTGAAERKFSYATYFESNMVLQMAPARASVWGYAPSSAIGETVVVSLTSSVNAHSYTALIVPGNHMYSILDS